MFGKCFGPSTFGLTTRLKSEDLKRAKRCLSDLTVTLRLRINCESLKFHCEKMKWGRSQC